MYNSPRNFSQISEKNAKEIVSSLLEYLVERLLQEKLGTNLEIMREPAALEVQAETAIEKEVRSRARGDLLEEFLLPRQDKHLVEELLKGTCTRN